MAGFSVYNKARRVRLARLSTRRNTNSNTAPPLARRIHNRHISRPHRPRQPCAGISARRDKLCTHRHIEGGMYQAGARNNQASGNARRGCRLDRKIFCTLYGIIPPYPCKIFETRKDSKPQSKKIHTEVLTFRAKSFQIPKRRRK